MNTRSDRKELIERFSEEFNQSFEILNSLVKQNIVSSHITPNGGLEITILGRDVEFDNELESVGSGMIMSQLLRGVTNGI